MSMFPELEKLRSKAKMRITQARGKFGAQKGLNSQMGGGAIINQVQAKVAEVRGRINTIIGQFPAGASRRPRTSIGMRNRLQGDVTSLPVPTRSGKGLQVGEEPGGRYDLDIAVER